MTMLTFADPKECWIKISPDQQQKFWQQSPSTIDATARWSIYLNHLCFDLILSWLQTEQGMKPARQVDSNPFSIWHVVNGSAINLHAARVVLIPSEAIDATQLEVPQEWVDISEWMADYYLAVQITSNGEWLRIWGYTTHQALKENARYDAADRTYCLDQHDLNQDMTTLWSTLEHCPNSQTQAEIAPLADISDVNAANLIQRLGKSSSPFTRLKVPFVHWAALMRSPEWRQQLYQIRLGQSNALSSLSSWLNGQIDQVWQEVDAVLGIGGQPSAAWRTLTAASQAEDDEPQISAIEHFAIHRAKVLDLGDATNNEPIALIVGVAETDEAEKTVGIEIRPVNEQANLTSPIQLRLLDANNNELSQASSVAAQRIQLNISGQSGELFSVEVSCGEVSLTENFEI